MTTTLDTVVTVAIGAETPNGTILPRDMVAAAAMVKTALQAAGATIVATTHGQGVASDDDRLGTPEPTAVIVAINPDPDRIGLMRYRIADVLRAFDMTSACCAIDGAHEPVWAATLDGSRPGA